MKRIVIDASVAVKWYLPEEDTPQARALLVGAYVRVVPDLVFTEVSSAFLRQVRAETLTLEEAGNSLQELGDLELDVYPTRPLLPDALALATRYGRSLYDAVYLALALREGAPLVTADRRFLNAFQDTPLAAALLWVGDFAAHAPLSSDGVEYPR
jgi:predicted nucleic acid-binding protein